MVKTYSKKGACCASGKEETAGGCRVEALISVDERGQTVLPKELRERNNIKAGDKFAVVSWEKDGELCCLTLIKADNLAESIRAFLGPLMGGVVDGGGPETPVEDSENETGRA